MTETAGQLGSGSAAFPAVIADRYRLERELGRGSAAIVWLAHDMVQGRDVAVKVLRPEVAHTVASDRFLEEIRIDTELSHPHLLPVLGSGEFDGLLYCVTPYIAGGSLRARMDRERQMPVELSLSLVSDVADALEYAHRHGVIHRDVKPENILIEGDHAFVADFGIARALTRAADERITSTGISVGTPAYMSPEQAAGNRDLDDRTDLYSLACVLYEMLAGVAPFVGPSPESVIAQRFVHNPHPLRVYRATVPVEVERAVARAMAIAPADRFRSMREFAAAINTRDAVPAAATTETRRRWGRRESIVTGGVLAVLVGAVATARTLWPVGDEAVTGADTSRYLVATVSAEGGAGASTLARRRMVEALRRWRDISVIEADVGIVNDASSPALSPRDAASLAKHAGVGRVVTASLGEVGDSVELRATVHDANGSVVRERALRVASRDSAGVMRLYRGMSAALLGGGDVSDDLTTSAAGTDRVTAWRAYNRGRAALSQWDLAAAIRDLRVAVAQDPRYAQALLWLAQAEAWLRPEHPEEWQGDALHAASMSSRLSSRDSLLASGVASLATLDFPKACETYRQVIAEEPRSELGWFGLAQCQAMDSIVVRDARSPSGWRFRASFHAAVTAYDSAIARAAGAPTFAFLQYRRLLFTDHSRLRGGRLASSEKSRFFAHPSVDADTLAFVPYPSAKVLSGAPTTLPATFALALKSNADRLDTRLREWVRRAPTNADALASLAFVQEVRGESATGEGGGLAALATLRSAARQSSDTLQRIVLSTNIIRVLVKDEQFQRAREVSDSLLDANPNPSPTHAKFLAGVAALVGQVGRTERLYALASSVPGELTNLPLPSPVTNAAARLTADAALGVCNTRVTTLVGDVEQLVERYVEPERRAVVRTELLARPLSLAVPCLTPAILDRVPASDDRLIAMQRALGRGDRRTVRAHLDTLARMRRVDRSGDITLDVGYQEAWLILAIRDTAGAYHRVCTPISAMSTLGTLLLRDVPQAAAVGRSLALCAELGARRGDTVSARRWAQDVLMLWSSADATLQPVLADMRTVAASQ